jgi:hypothetical protein
MDTGHGVWLSVHDRVAQGSDVDAGSAEMASGHPIHINHGRLLVGFGCHFTVLLASPVSEHVS